MIGQQRWSRPPTVLWPSPRPGRLCRGCELPLSLLSLPRLLAKPGHTFHFVMKLTRGQGLGGHANLLLKPVEWKLPRDSVMESTALCKWGRGTKSFSSGGSESLEMKRSPGQVPRSSTFLFEHWEREAGKLSLKQGWGPEPFPGGNITCHLLI